MATRRTDPLVGVAAATFGAGAGVLDGVGFAGIAAGAVVGGVLATARGQPRLAWFVCVVALIVSATAGAPSFGLLVLVAAHAFCAGRWETRWSGIAALAALVAALELGVLLDNNPGGVPALVLPIAGWGAGRALRERELVAAQLAERLRELDEEREAHASLSVRYERARIASELHDIVAHAISVMVIQASAGQRLAHDPEATAQTFDAIAGAARQAERDMSRLVALLGDERAIGRAPDLALVEELVARASSSGLDVTLRFAGDREGLPTPVAQAAYHVVQEGLTNALRYAAGASVRVRLDGQRKGLVVEVTNAPTRGDAALAGVGTRTGLQGLRERVDACGGLLEAGPTADGGWRLRAHLPRRVTAAAGSAELINTGRR